MRAPFSEFIKKELGPGTLLITCGLPGTWKTETSEEISKIKGYPILRSDLIRLEVLKNEDVFDEKVAENMSRMLHTLSLVQSGQLLIVFTSNNV